jgi:hypothetical protein
MLDAEVIASLDAAFGNCARPEHFTDYQHCCECAEHDELLRSRDRRSLQLHDVGNPGWDPLCFTSAEGLLYFIPRLGRLALSLPEPGFDWYAPQLHFHLTYEGPENRILRAATRTQRAAVVTLLRHIVQTRRTLCEEWACRDDLLAAAELWEKGSWE